MSNPGLYPYIYAQEVTLHIRVGRKFNFLSQLSSILGPEALQETLASPIPLVVPMLSRGLIWEIFVFVLL